LIILDALNSGGETEWQHLWTWEGDTNQQTPAATFTNMDNDIKLRVNKTALDGDRMTEVELIIPGTTLKIVDTLESNRFVQYYVETVTDNGAYQTFDVVKDLEGILGVPPDDVEVLIEATIPQPQLTKYREIADHWVANQPTFATVEGQARLGGEDQVGVENNAYGVRLHFQPAVLSPAWKMLARTP
jgi:hypothetical protein